MPMLKWLPIKNKDGTINKHAIEDSSGRYRISRSTVKDGERFTVWRGPVAIFYGSAEEAKMEAFEDSQKSHEVTSREAAESALEMARRLLNDRSSETS